ncbi:HNH endonuclease signature motif containing protein [Rathayibacter toxicus]|uniref:HNH endonuclease n=1 Tax=Rathayibacter toxicus TaxID=145458 RepID=A0A2S5Y8E0_9MICO|nr:HNH endonuclease signature motif containing protein [Rathayibacter toxicus]PPH24756.1 HNH endonuclease [Rathayibacter toxicus]PPH58684.1 HNH endonuclease [Rathayibacter toxicus]PPH60676.1 HNH endonuclease [Rathayibacter toxicus]PPH88496.1 HNH endonuclease [Rathayibacter toxicus]PPI16189.1 HNH endonuclease [Rathayibacter toxicus]
MVLLSMPPEREHSEANALHSALDALCSTNAARSHAQARHYEAVERARQAALRSHTTLVEAQLPAADRAEAAQRALVAELATVLHMSETSASALLTESRLLINQLPLTLTALRDGLISPELACIITRAALDLPPATREQFDNETVVLARESTPPQLRQRLRVLREQLHPENLTVRHRRCAQRRALWLEGAEDGMALLHLYLPAPEAHGAFDRVNRVARSLSIVPGEQRSIGQLRADVAATLLTEAETDVTPNRSTSTPIPAGIQPRISVTVPVLTLLGHSHTPATLDGHGPIDADTARRLAAHAPSFTRLLTHPETGAVLSVGRDSYRVPADLRRYLQHRDHTCRFPGCTRTTLNADIDHTNDWHHGGATDATNLAHLCRHHHRLRHTSTWTSQQDPDGTLHWTSPTGRQHSTRAATPEPSPSY